ncbi:MAG: hypothetical protein RLZZ574_1523 [Cyanobacteriota bacterium]
MKSVSGKKLSKIVKKKGWVLRKVTGSHHIYAKTGVNKILSIPVHKLSLFRKFQLPFRLYHSNSSSETHSDKGVFIPSVIDSLMPGIDCR